MRSRLQEMCVVVDMRGGDFRRRIKRQLRLAQSSQLGAQSSELRAQNSKLTSFT